MKDLESSVTVRFAERRDIDAIIALFADDEVGGHGDTLDPAARPDYVACFDAIAANPTSSLYVAELDGVIVGTFQATILATMSGRGSSSLILSAVQTKRDMRSRGIGRRMICYAIERAKESGASAVQLSSNNLRTDAHRFYLREGFAKSHAGFKMKL